MSDSGKRICVLCDLEGVSGVVNWDTDTGRDQPNYQRSLRLATNELNALLRGLKWGGAEEILVVDGHGEGGLELELVTEEADVLIGRPITVPYWLDGGWDGVAYFAHHSMAGTEGGNLCHSWSHVSVVEVRLNNQPVGEIGWYIYLAGYFKSPAILVTGDDKACAEAKRLAPAIETAVVKTGLNATTAICKPPPVAQNIIGRAAGRAMQRLAEMTPVPPPGPPFRVTRTYAEASMAEAFCSSKEWAQRVDERTVAVESDDYLDLSKKFL